MDHETQMRQHELAGGVEVVVLAQPIGQLDLFVLAKNGDHGDGLDVGIQTANGTGQDKVGIAMHQGFCHLRASQTGVKTGTNFSTPDLRVLNRIWVPY
jgi:hypothetical protein